MRHAYLMIVHSNWEQLKILLRMLDDEHNDIYIHIDKKSINAPVEELRLIPVRSDIYIYSEYKVYWGGFVIVETELFLFEKASANNYDYYHLISGMDLPIKTQEYIITFFEKNKGCEFVHFDTDERLKNDNELKRRTQLYHFLQNYRRRDGHKFFNAFFTWIERILLVIQLVFRVDRMKKYPDFCVKYGSQWVSITNDLVKYIVSQKGFIYDMFQYTNCADELFIQSLVYNSEFITRLYRESFDDDIHGNMRLIDMKRRGNNGNPYTWRISDWDEIRKSDCLFARKFNENDDMEIIKKVYCYVKH